MSIYTKIFATASIFAIAASALITPAVSAGTTGITISGYTAAQNYSLCLTSASNGSVQLVAGQNANQSQTISLSQTPTVGAPLTYTLSLRTGTDSCNGNVLSTSTTPIVVYANHNTNVTIVNTASAITSVVATPYNQKAYVTSNGGNASINFCLNKIDSQTVVFTDPDGDNLIEAATATVPTGFSASGAATANGTYTYTIYPNSTATNTLGASGSFTFSVKEQATAIDTPVTAATVVNYSVSNSCASIQPVVASSSVMASSSMAASSTASSTSTAASAVAATSSKAAATVEVDAPSVGKGSATVRTGGAY